MRILVCVKQVPDTESVIEIDAAGLWIQETEKIVYRMNRFDEYALEEAVRIRESASGVTIDALSVGPERVRATVTKALEKGADNGIHIACDGNGYQSPVRIAAAIATYARPLAYDLIFTGIMAEDDMQCQVGPMLAELLGLPSAPSVISETLEPTRDIIHVECEMEGGIREQLSLSLPCLLSIQSGINRPRYPALSNVLRAKKQELITVDAKTLALPEGREVMRGVFYPEKPSRGIILEGTSEEKAEKLLRILYEKSFL